MTQSHDIPVGIPCVNYADYLAHTLPLTVRAFRNVTVITTACDRASIRLARRHGAQVWTTDCWFANGAAFNKAGALNEWLASLVPGWTLVVDADIALPEGFQLDVARLESSCLYSIPRRVCQTEWDWVGPESTRPEYPLIIPPVRDGRVWRRPTANPAALSGYFQLWDRANAPELFFPGSPDASNYDVEFALQFPDERRFFLAGEVVHVGPVRQNWTGRVSPQWVLEPADTMKLPELLRARGASQIFRFRTGTRNPAYLCTSRTNAWVYKTVPLGDWQVAKETYLHRTLSRVPTPKVLAANHCSYVMEYGGLTSECFGELPESFFASCGHVLRQLHDETPEASRLEQRRYGKGPVDSMFAYDLRMSQCARWLERIPAHSPVFADLSAMLNRLQADAAARESFRGSPVCFTHGDYKAANVLTDGALAINLIDFEHAMYGDPDWDLHCFCQRAVEGGVPLESLRHFLRAYGAEETFLTKQKFYRYFRAFQKCIGKAAEDHDRVLADWVQSIRDGSDTYLRCELV